MLYRCLWGVHASMKKALKNCVRKVNRHAMATGNAGLSEIEGIS